MPNPNVGLFSAPAVADQADPALDVCMEYMSCVGQLAYFDRAPDADTATTACNNALSDFANTAGSSTTYYLGDGAWKLANSIREDMAYQASIGGSAKETLYAGTYNAFQLCAALGWTTVRPTQREYYQVVSVVDNWQYRLAIVTINCPGDGTTGGNSYGIENCHIDTFADNTGSGVYSGGCYYSE